MATATPIPGGDYGLYSVQWVDPNGNNANTGTENAPRKTCAKAMLSLANGGTIHVAPGTTYSDGTEAPGLTAGQGMWLTQSLSPQPAGFLPIRAMTIKGWGGNTFPFGVNPAFSAPSAYLPWGAQDGLNRFNPAVWIVSNTQPVKFEDVYFLANTPIKLGVDHRRNADTSLAFGNITGAVKANGVTTLTVTYPPGYPLSQYTRTSGVVTATITTPQAPPLYSGNIQWLGISGATDPGLLNGNGYTLDTWSPSSEFVGAITYTDDTTFILSASDSAVNPHTLNITEFDFTGRLGAKITLNGTSSDGTRNVTAVNSAHQVVVDGSALTSQTFSSAMTATVRMPDVGLTAVSAGEMVGHFVINPNRQGFPLAQLNFDSGLQGAFFDVITNDANFPSSYYQMCQTTPTTISYLDPYGVPGSSGAIGTYLTEDRFYSESDSDFWHNCYFQITGTGGNSYGSGPAINRGGNSWVGTYEYCGAQTLDIVDPNRSALMLAASVGAGAGSASFVFNKLFMTTGHIRVFGGSIPALAQLNTVIGDPATATNVFPILKAVSGAVAVTAHDCTITDVASGTPAIDLGYSFGPVSTTNTTVVGGAFAGGRYAIPDGNISRLVQNQTLDWRQQQVSQDALGYAGTWGTDGRLAGRRSDAQSQFGVVQHLGLTNQVNDDLTTWAGTVTAGQSDPMGGTRGYIITADINSTTTLGANLAAGDTVILSAWFRSNSGTLNAGGELAEVELIGPAFPDSIAITPFPSFGGKSGDWQELRWSVTISSAAAGGNQITWHLFAGAYTIALVTAYVLPVATYSGNESARIFQTHRHVPKYLAAGAAGTYDGVPLTGHGGLVVGDAGIATAILRLNTAASAAAIAGGANFAGLRWNAGTGKIEYCKPGGAWTTLV